jgi:hypothetical protein
VISGLETGRPLVLISGASFFSGLLAGFGAGKNWNSFDPFVSAESNQPSHPNCAFHSFQVGSWIGGSDDSYWFDFVG